MGRTYLVDGYNALFAAGPPPQDRDVARRLVLGWSRRALQGGTAGVGGGDRVHVLFDTRTGGGRPSRHGKDGRVSWEYVEGSADDAAVAYLRLPEVDPRDVVVVTNDRELAARARQARARAVRVAEFFGDVHTVGGHPPAARPPSPAGPPMRPEDFGLPSGPLDLGTLDPDDL